MSLRALRDIRAERAAQDAQWGGAKHDDGHRPELWDGVLWKFLRRVAAAGERYDAHCIAERRRRLVQLAAVCVAAIDSIDRKTGP